MQYLTLNEAKNHLNIDTDFINDDDYIEMLIDVAVNAVETHLNVSSLDNIISAGGKFPPAVKAAMLLLIGNYYANREPVTYGKVSSLPNSYEYLLSPYKNYEN